MHEASWYALYVKSRTEKRVYKRLIEQEIESYLPLLKTLRQWSDRKKLVEAPLFSSYVFVRTNPVHFNKIRAIEGIVNFVRFDGKPAPIPDNQVDNLKLLLYSGEKFEISPDEFETGEDAEVIAGPLKGFKGTFVNYKGKKYAMLRIDAINRSLIIKISPSYLKKITTISYFEIKGH
jgi:transcriptional antiterminator RfaH